MFEFLISLLAFLFAIGLLVTIHEYGHFWVARKVGVRVLKFSIGFGKPLFSFTDRHGTEFVLAAIPLGGYVKMLDEREGHVDESELCFAFNRKTVWERIAVVCAGPLANFLFATLAFFIVYLIGIKGLAPVVGEVRINSMADTAGLQMNDEIVRVNNVYTSTTQSVIIEFLSNIGLDYNIPIVLKRSDNQSIHTTLNFATNTDVNAKILLDRIGFTFQEPYLKPIIGQVSKNLAADIAGLKSGDLLLRYNDIKLETWQDFVQLVRANPNLKARVDINRQGRPMQLFLTPALKVTQEGGNVGVIGAKLSADAWPTDKIRNQRFSPVESFNKAVKHTWDLSILTIQMITKMLVGKIDFSGLGGPISIAKGAGQSVQVGSEYYLAFLGLISVSLGVINLLPVPVLDGGHLLYFLIEVVTGKALSQQVQQIGASIGMLFLLFVMGIALYNDFAGLSN